MNEITGRRSSWTRSRVSSFPIGSTLHEPIGKSVSAMISPRMSAESGVAGAGLMMIGAPIAMAGATLWATRLSGKLNGAIPRIGPFENRRTRARRPAAAGSVSSRCRSPDQRRASSAAQRNVETARPTSALAHMMGLPFSAVMTDAISSPRAAIWREMWSRAAARALAGSAADARTESCAPATACSTS